VTCKKRFQNKTFVPHGRDFAIPLEALVYKDRKPTGYADTDRVLGKDIDAEYDKVTNE